MNETPELGESARHRSHCLYLAVSKSGGGVAVRLNNKTRNGRGANNVFGPRQLGCNVLDIELGFRLCKPQLQVIRPELRQLS